MGIITRIGNSPGARRLVKRAPRPGEVRENGDDDDDEPKWCADCHREVLFELPKCPDCGGKPLTATELAQHVGDLARPGSASPTSWFPTASTTISKPAAASPPESES
jgi:hypothetical protein